MLARQLETLYYLGWTENYLERYDHAIAHAQRGIALARTTGEGRLLIPLMLVQGYPFEMQGRVQEAVAMCEGAVEAARLAANPHYLFWTLFELGWAHYYAGHLEAATDACEESLRIGGRLTKGTMPSAGGGPGWALGVCRFEAGDVQALLDTMQELGDADLDWAIPVEKCFNWEILALADIALGRPDSAAAYAARAEQDGAALDLKLPAAIAARTRAAVALAAGDAGVAVERSRASVAGAAAAGATMQEAFSRALLGRALAAAGERTEAIAELREAERALDGFGSVRPRDEVRRELRKLGRPQRAARAGEGGRLGSGLADQTRARDRTAGHRPAHEPRDRCGAVPQRQDDRVAPAERLHEARRLVADRGRADDRARRRWRCVSVAVKPTLDADSARLAELGYDQELDAQPADLRQRRARLRGRSRRSSGCTPSCSSGRWSRARHGSGCCRSRWPASVCCSSSTPSSRRSSRSPAAPTSGRGA